MVSGEPFVHSRRVLMYASLSERQVGPCFYMSTESCCLKNTKCLTGKHYLACKVSLTPLNYKRVSPKFSTFLQFKCHQVKKRASAITSAPVGPAAAVRRR